VRRALEVVMNEGAVTAFLAALNVVQAVWLAELRARTAPRRRRKKRPPAG